MIDQLPDIPPFLMLSVPKSGTHMLYQILLGIPKLTDTRQLNFNLLQTNQFGWGHKFYTESYTNMIEQNNIKHVFIYRDPRDVLISYTHHTSHFNDQPLSPDFLVKYPTLKQQLIAILLGGDQSTSVNFHDIFIPHYQWLYEKEKSKSIFFISYEELVSSPESRRTVIENLVGFLYNLDPEENNQLVESMIHQIDPASCPTFRAGNVGSWRTEFDADVKQVFKNTAGNLLTVFGFEPNNDW